MQLKEQTPYTMCVGESYFYMHCSTTGAHFSPIISSAIKQLVNNSNNNYVQINRKTNKVKEISFEQYQVKVKANNIKQVIKFYLLMGCIIINQQPYLLLATDISQVARYIQYPIYIINEVQFIPYRRKLFQKVEDLEDENKIIDELKRNHINRMFYFSYKENITTALITQHIERKYHFQFNQFAWNTNILDHFIKSKIHLCWTIPIIQGFVAQIVNTNKYLRYQYISISRRSIHMSGTRFNSRGIDEDANPSNFVQTEEIVKHLNHLYVHISVRGSVPLFWKQIKVRSNINYVKDKDIDEQSIIKEHYSHLQRRYGAETITINLLSKEKSPEKQLKNRFEAIFNRNMKNYYLFFDLNDAMEDKINGQQLVTKFIEKNLPQIFGQHPFMIMQNITKQLTFTQSMQNMNKIKIAPKPMQSWLGQANSSQNLSSSTQDSQVDLQQKKLVFQQSFIDKVIDIWAGLGDKISQIYCGTASVASHMTKKKNNTIRTFLGSAITSLNRYINANTTDIFKQQCIDCFLGRRGELSSTDYFNTNIITKKIKMETYCQLENAKICILTFNTNWVNPQGNDSQRNFLRFVDFCKCQVLIFNFQDVSGSSKWIEKLDQQITKKQYRLLMHYKYQKPSLLTIIYTTKSQLNFNFKFIKVIEIPLKSYGALSIFLQINNSLICIINCKLQSGYQNATLRVDDINSIHQFLLMQTYYNNFFKKSQYIFIAGDLNLRLSNNIHKEFKFKNVIEELYNSSLIKQTNSVKEALQYDQLNLLRKNHFNFYEQGEIDFFPTYKYNNKRSGYDRTKYPAWCDRIIYSGGLSPKKETELSVNLEKVKCLQYKRIEQNFGSSHKGVLGMYQIVVKRQDSSKKEQIIQEYLY